LPVPRELSRAADNKKSESSHNKKGEAKMSSTPNRSRRSFFKKFAWVGGALVLSGRLWKGASPTARADSGTGENKAGYRLTPHIRKYYETAAK
jgi:hypothetical protein